MASSQEKRLKILLTRYEQKVFAFSINLHQGNRAVAFDVTASAFAELAKHEAIQKHVLRELAGAVIKKSQSLDLKEVDRRKQKRPAKQNDLNVEDVLRQVIYDLPFKMRAAVLLRDLLNLEYQEIGHLFHLSVNATCQRVDEARLIIKDHLEKVTDASF